MAHLHAAEALLPEGVPVVVCAKGVEADTGALMTQVMPFALSLGITRRHFYLGTVLLVAAETLVSAIGLSVLLAVERAEAGGAPVA